MPDEHKVLEDDIAKLVLLGADENDPSVAVTKLIEVVRDDSRLRSINFVIRDKTSPDYREAGLVLICAERDAPDWCLLLAEKLGPVDRETATAMHAPLVAGTA